MTITVTRSSQHLKKTLEHTARLGRPSPASVMEAFALLLGYDTVDDLLQAFQSPWRVHDFEAPRLLFGLASNSKIRCLLIGWDSPLTLFFLGKVKEPRNHSLGNLSSARQTSPLPSDESASLPQVDEPWSPEGPVRSKDTSLITIR